MELDARLSLQDHCCLNVNFYGALKGLKIETMFGKKLLDEIT